jgi:hypothetical protein
MEIPHAFGFPRILRSSNATSKRAVEKAKIGERGNSGTRVLVVEVVDVVVDDEVVVVEEVPSSRMGLSVTAIG